MIRARRAGRKEARLAALEALAKVRRALYTLERSKAVLEAAYRRTRDPALREMIAAYSGLGLALERVAVRLETLAVAGFVSKSLVEAPLRQLKEAMKAGGPPPLTQVLAEIMEDLTALYAVAAPEPPDVLAGALAESPKAEEILNLAEVEARRRAERAAAGGES